MKKIDFRDWKEKTKFRVWLEKLKIMQYSDILSSFFKGYEIEYIPIMQFTGIKDKNGKEIYEGDILKFTIVTYPMNVDGWGQVYHYLGKELIEFNKTPPKKDIRTAIVNYVMSSGKYVMTDVTGWRNWDLYEYELKEIIGNIYQNPEFLSKDAHVSLIIV